jgi:hypothetical protein
VMKEEQVLTRADSSVVVIVIRRGARLGHIWI